MADSLAEVLGRLAALERQASLSAAELTELNDLRTQLLTRWPEIAVAVVRAYLASGSPPS